MNTVWTGRVAQAAAKYGDHAPMVATCCNACRTCVQINLVAGALAAVIAVVGGVTRFARRLSGART